MIDEVPRSYTVEVLPCLKPERHFISAVRKHGQLLERSDRTYESEKAYRDALKAAERDRAFSVRG